MTRSFFAHNMSFNDIILRYVAMITLGIVGGLTHQIWLMALAVPFLVMGTLGWCPLYAITGTNHSSGEHGTGERSTPERH